MGKFATRSLNLNNLVDAHKKRISMMEQIERIKLMERHLDCASNSVMQLSAALEQYASAQDAISALSAYYGSDEWKRDFAADEAGLLPKDLKRGVLSEDAIWNLLEDAKELNERMRDVFRDKVNDD